MLKNLKEFTFNKKMNLHKFNMSVAEKFESKQKKGFLKAYSSAASFNIGAPSGISGV